MFRNCRTRLTLTSLERRETPAQFHLAAGEAVQVAVLKTEPLFDPREKIGETIELGPEWITEDNRAADEAMLEQQLADEGASGFTSSSIVLRQRKPVDETKIRFGTDNIQLVDDVRT